MTTPEKSDCGGSGSCHCNGNRRTWLVLGIVVLGLLIGWRVLKGDNASDAQPKPTVASITKLPRLVDLGAGKCIPCKMMAPILTELKHTYSNELEVTFIDVWENPEAGKEYGIRIIPTQIFFGPDGKELFRHEGFFSREDILAKWKAVGFDLGKP